jgi:hypothetical protein
MPRVSQCFFVVAVVCAIVGIAWGMHMAENNNHLQMPAHAHLNLLGWVGSAIFGTYFALNPGRFRKTAWLVFILNTTGVVVMIPLLALFYASGFKATEYLIPLTVGTFFVLGAMVVFATAVLRGLLSKGT